MKIFNNIYGCLSGTALCILLCTGLAGCTDDLGIKTQSQTELGSKVSGTLSVPLITPSGDVRTRAVDFSENALIKIDAYWIGIYDTQTGELLGTARDDMSRKQDGTRETVTTQSPFTVKDINITYYENHPEVYVVGVINYNDILAKRTPGEGVEKENLIDILSSANNIKDLFTISLDLQTVKAANFQESSGLQQRPLMMGYYMPESANRHAMVDLSGSGFTDFSNNRVTITDAPNGGLQLQSGNIRLERLMADINVNIQAGEGVTISNVQYQIVNNPTEMYLAEHIVDNAGSIRSTLDEYLANTANSADFLDEGYIDDGSFRYAYSSPEGYHFNYQEYENKHWARSRIYPGSENELSHMTREQKYNPEDTWDKAVYRSLCSDADKPFNNNASFMIIKADVTVEPYTSTGYFKAQSGTVYYAIHEGCASSREGNSSYNGFDYQRMRNTSYTYNITINGLDQLESNVTASDLYNRHNNGVAGNLWTTQIVYFDSENRNVDDSPVTSFTFNSPEELLQMEWRLLYSDPDGATNWGNWSIRTIPGKPSDFPQWPRIDSWADIDANVFPAEHEDDIYFMIPGQIFQKVNVNDIYTPGKAEEYNYPLTLLLYVKNIHVEDIDYNNIDEYYRGFYLCFTDYSDNAGASTPQYVKGWEQNAVDKRSDLSYLTPSYIPNNHLGPYGSNVICTAPGLVCYIDWSPIGPAEAYTLQIDDLEPIYIDPDVYGNGALYPSISYPYEVPKNLSPGAHVVKITPHFDPSLYKPGQPKVLPVPLVIEENRSKWDFADENFIKLVYSYGLISEENGTYFFSSNSGNRGLEQSGLEIYANNRMSVATPENNLKYFQTRGTGSTTDRCFKFNVYGSGTVKVMASGTGNNPPNDERYLNLHDTKANSVVSTIKVTNGTGNLVEYTLRTSENIDSHTEVTIFTTYSLNIYSIEWIPD